MTGRQDRAGVRGGFGTIAAAALLVLIVIVGMLAYFGRTDENRRPDTATSPTAARPTEPSGSLTGFAAPEMDILGRRVDVPNNPVGQPLPQEPASQRTIESPDWLTGAPHGTTRPGGWQRVYGASLPFSTSDGPARIDDGLAVGFSHTPQGAALAAAHIYYRVLAHPADHKIYRRQILLNPDQLAAIDRGEARLPMSVPEEVTRYLIASEAFRIGSYNDDFAVVQLALPATLAGARTWKMLRLAVAWVDGDWRLEPPWQASGAITVVSLEGWTPW